MIRVEKDNVQLQIENEDLQKYLNNGYKKTKIKKPGIVKTSVEPSTEIKIKEKRK